MAFTHSVYLSVSLSFGALPPSPPGPSLGFGPGFLGADSSQCGVGVVVECVGWDVCGFVGVCVLVVGSCVCRVARKKVPEKCWTSDFSRINFGEIPYQLIAPAVAPKIRSQGLASGTLVCDL